MTGAAPWSGFFAAETAAAAALAGLIFVGVSINLPKVLAYPGVPERALESLGLMLGVLVISSVALVPNLPDRWLGCVFAVIGGAAWIAATAFQVRLRIQHPSAASSRAGCRVPRGVHADPELKRLAHAGRLDGGTDPSQNVVSRRTTSTAGWSTFAASSSKLITTVLVASGTRTRSRTRRSPFSPHAGSSK